MGNKQIPISLRMPPSPEERRATLVGDVDAFVSGAPPAAVPEMHAIMGSGPPPGLVPITIHVPDKLADRLVRGQCSLRVRWKWPTQERWRSSVSQRGHLGRTWDARPGRRPL